MAATNAAPRKITFRLGLTAPSNKYKMESTNGEKARKPKYGVKLTGPRGSWKNVSVGDLVQFVPDTNDRKLRGATIRVRFVGGEYSNTPKSPFDVGMIRSSAFHKVAKQQSKFWVRCIIVTSDGKEWGYGFGGKVICDLPPCH